MNHYSYEVLAKEKIKGFHEEGLGSQTHYRSGALGFSLFRGLPKLIMVLLAILGVLGLMVR